MSEPTFHKTFTGSLIAPDGTERHFINGCYGREGDLPAVIYPDGTKLWYTPNPKRGSFGQRNELAHRGGDLPAIERVNGDRLWYQMGKLHRDGDLPAMVLADGTQKWFKEGDCTGYLYQGMTDRKVC